jgi:hypothetical protein
LPAPPFVVGRLAFELAPKSAKKSAKLAFFSVEDDDTVLVRVGDVEVRLSFFRLFCWFLSNWYLGGEDTVFFETSFVAKARKSGCYLCPCLEKTIVVPKALQQDFVLFFFSNGIPYSRQVTSSFFFLLLKASFINKLS